MGERIKVSSIPFFASNLLRCRFAATAAAAFSAKGNEQMTRQDSTSSEILKDRVAVITGAARGIGRAAAVALARSGANVAGIDICAVVDGRSGVTPATQADLDETGRLVQAAGGKWQGFVVDQRDLAKLRSTAIQIEQTFGGLTSSLRTPAFNPSGRSLRWKMPTGIPR
jgi:hypothetical protein